MNEHLLQIEEMLRRSRRVTSAGRGTRRCIANSTRINAITSPDRPVKRLSLRSVLTNVYFQMSVIGAASRSPAASGSRPKLSSIVRRTLSCV